MSLSARDRLVEAITGRKLDAPLARSAVVGAATDLVALGDTHPTVIELASTYRDSPPLMIDEVVSRVVDELDIAGELAVEVAVRAARPTCRAVLDGAASARDLAAWAYLRFPEMDSGTPLIDELVALDDEYVIVDDRRAGPDRLDERVRAIASALLDMPL